MKVRWLWGLTLAALVLALGSGGGVAQYGGEGEYGGVQLRFSGQLTTAGGCEQVAQNLIRCQVPTGRRGTIQLTATVTPPSYPVSVFAVSLPSWASFQPVSTYGTAQTTCTFTPPAGAAGQSFQLRFRASTVYGLSVDLTVVLNVVVVQPPTGPEYPEAEYTTDERGRFSVPVDYPPNTTVKGTLTECTRYPLAGVPISIALLPKSGRLNIGSLDDVGAVQIDTPYGSTTVTEFNLLSSIDENGRITRTINVGVVCLQPSGPIPPVPPTETIPGTTDEEGKFSVPLPGQPGTTVTGRLTECTVRPLPNQEFTLTPIYGEGTLNGFTIDVPGYEPVTITEFGRFSLFGLTSYLLGDMCLSLEIGDEEDLLPWRPDRSLTWEDFKADPPADVEGRDEAAFIKYRLIVEPTEFRLTYDPNTKTWRATIDPASLKVKNVMVRSESWVDPQRKNARLLSHEQGHFDISEVYRRLLERRLRELVAEAPTQEQAAAELRRLIERTYNSVVQKAEQVQTDYDRETAHGQDQEKQEAWGRKIQEWLADPTKAPQP